MGTVGKQNFANGITTRDRVQDPNGDALEICSGYDGLDGSLVPEKVTKVLDGWILANFSDNTCGVQIPTVVKTGGVRDFAIVSDYDNKLRKSASLVLDGNTNEGDLVTEPETVSVRFGKQILYPTKAGIKAYEPGSPSTKIRSLSLKSPEEYRDATTPVIALETWPGVKLYASDEGAPVWTEHEEVTYTEKDDYVQVAILAEEHETDTMAPGDAILSTTLATDISLDGLSWLMLDYMISGEVQEYDVFGLFPNDPLMRPSGYCLKLIDDSNPEVEIATLRLPKPELHDRVYRAMINIGALTDTVHKVELILDDMWEHPTVKNATIALLTGNYSDTWNFYSNYLLPSPTYTKSPYAKGLVSIIDPDDGYDSADNLIPNSEFDTNTSGWTLIGDVERLSADDRNAEVGFMTLDDILDGKIDSSHQSYISSDPIEVQENLRYTLSFWARGSSASNAPFNHNLLVRLEFSTPDIAAETYRYFPSNLNFDEPKDTSRSAVSTNKLTYYDYKSTKTWVNTTISFQVPSGAQYVSIKFAKKWTTYNFAKGHNIPYPSRMCLDGITLFKDNYKKSNTTIFLMSNNGNYNDPIPDIHKVKYNYCFAGKSLLGSKNYSALLSNAAVNDSPVVTANPWQKPWVSADNTDVDETEYGDYLSNILWFRSIYDGSTKTWGNWECIYESDYEEYTTMGDHSFDALKTILMSGNTNTVAPPSDLPTTYDSAPSARHLVVKGKRLYMGCLNWDEDASSWLSPTAIQVSSMNMPWACPVDLADPLPTDGQFIDEYAENGSELRAMVALGDNIVVYLDNEFFMLLGDNPGNFAMQKIDSIGNISAKATINCRGSIIWSDGVNFYTYSGARAQNISKFQIDASLIDFSSHHSCTYWSDKYFLFCKYDDVYSLLIYDILGGFWRIRTSPVFSGHGNGETYHIVGITSDADGVFGLTQDGYMLDFFGATEEEWSDDNIAHVTRREVCTKYITVSDPGFDLHIGNLMFEINSPVDQNIMCEVWWQGAKCGSLEYDNNTAITIELKSDITRYNPGVNINCNAIKLKLTWDYAENYSAPTILFMGVVTDELKARVRAGLPAEES